MGAQLPDSLLVVMSVLALGWAAFRLASVVVPAGLERVITTVVFAAAAAVIEALGLGLFGLGGSAAALTIAACLTALVMWRLAPAPGQAAGTEFAAWWGSRPIVAVVGVGGVLGGIGAVAATQLRRPLLGTDAVTYHVPEVIGFVQSGHPGRVFQNFYGLPVGSYPLTEEVLLGWITGIAHGYAPMLLLTIFVTPLLIAAGWLGLRELKVDPRVAALAIAAVVLTPLISRSWVQPGTDLPALSWLCCGAALCLAARRTPLLIAPAIVAFALAVGTKTTVLTWSLVILAATLWFSRARLRAIAVPLAASTVVGALAGLVWYARNWIDHSSPLWPFYATPGGQPVPAMIRALSTTMVESLHRTLIDHLSIYVQTVSGAVALLILGMAIPLLAGSRRALIAGLVVALGVLEYASGPVTGLPAHGTLLVGAVGSTLRYLMPALTAGAVALALAATDGKLIVRALALIALCGVLVWDLISNLNAATVANSTFYLPFAHWLAPGVIIGILLALVSRTGFVSAALRWFAARRVSAVSSAVVAALVVTFVLADGSKDFLYRNADVRDLDSPVAAFLGAQPGFLTGHAPVASTQTGLGGLAGDRLNHPLSMITVNEPCSRIYSAVERGWVVLRVYPALSLPAHVYLPPGTATACLRPLHPLFDDGVFKVYDRASLPG
jgi:hypothetical protein